MKITTAIYLILIVFIALLGFGGFVDPEICSAIIGILTGIDLFRAALHEYLIKKNNGFFIFLSLISFGIFCLGVYQIYIFLSKVPY